MATENLFQLFTEWQPEESAGLQDNSEVRVPDRLNVAMGPPIGMREALKVLNKAMVWWVQRRILNGRIPD